MSVNITIKPLNEDQPLLSVEEIAKLMNLSYGYSDNNYCLVFNKTNKYTILYDEKKIGRGIEINYEDNSICLSIPLPTTSHDIDIFYQLVKKICEKMGVYFIQLDEDMVAVTDIGLKAEDDKDLTMQSLRRIAEAVSTQEHRYMILFGAINPIFIGPNEIREIGDSLDGFDKMMDRLQRIDAYYARPRFYKFDDEKIHGFYFLRDNVPTTVPLNPEYPFQKIENLHSYLVELPDENYIPYDVFINNIGYADYYDAEHITVTLTEEKISYYAENHAVDMNTLQSVKGFYWGKIIDAGYSHSNKIKRFNLDIDEICGVNHIAVFIRWANEHDLLSAELIEKCPELDKECPDYRNIFLKSPAFSGMLRNKHFNETGKAFVNGYYNFNTGNGFPACVDKVSENYFGTEKYNCEEFHNEAYLFTPYDEDYYKNLSAFIDAEWEKFNK